MIKTCRTWLSAFVQDWPKYKNNVNSLEISKDNSLYSYTDSTKADYRNSLFRMSLLIITVIAAFILVSQLDINIWIGRIILVFILSKILLDVRSLIFSASGQVCVQNETDEWFWANQNGNFEAQQLLMISKILDSGIILNIRCNESGKIRYVVVWERRANPRFMHYCRQISNFNTAK